MSDVGSVFVVVYTYRETGAIRLISAWKANRRQREAYEKSPAEKVRDIDFSRAKRGAVLKVEPGKTKISIRLDNRVIESFQGHRA